MLKKIIKLIKSDFFAVLASNTLVKFIAFFPSVFLARFLTKMELAEVSYADNLLSYLLTFAGLGFSAAVLRYCAKKDDENKYYGYYDVAIKYGTISHVLFLVVFAVVCIFINFKYGNAKLIFYLLLLTPLLQNIYDTCMNYLRTQGRFKLYSVVNVVYSVLKLVLLIGLTDLFAINGMIAARYISMVIVMAIIIFFSKGLLKRKEYTLTKEEKKGFCKYSIYTVITTACSSLMPINALFIINNVLADPNATSNYKVAMALPYNMMFITSAIVIYFTPMFAEHDKDKKWVWSKSVKLGVSTMILYVFIALFFLVSSKLLVLIIYGEKYLDAVPLMCGLAVAYAIQAGLQMIPMNILYAIGYVKNNMVNLAVTMVVELFLDVVLVKYFGIFGIVYATIVGSALSATEYWIYLFYVNRIKGEESVQ